MCAVCQVICAIKSIILIGYYNTQNYPNRQRNRWGLGSDICHISAVISQLKRAAQAFNVGFVCKERWLIVSISSKARFVNSRIPILANITYAGSKNISKYRLTFFSIFAYCDIKLPLPACYSFIYFIYQSPK